MSTFNRDDGTFAAVTTEDVSGSAWTSYTPTITAASGTFTSVSASGKYKQIGKTVFVSATITITTNGSATGDVRMTLPVNNNGSANFYGRGSAVSGKMLQGVRASASQIAILNYDNGYPGADGESLMVTGTYEST